MRSWPRLARALPLASAMAIAGCAHAPAVGESAGRERPGEVGERARAERVFVTGSRIPRPLGRDGLPATDSPVRIYWRDDVARAGDPDLARALWKLDVGAR